MFMSEPTDCHGAEPPHCLPCGALKAIRVQPPLQTAYGPGRRRAPHVSSTFTPSSGSHTLGASISCSRCTECAKTPPRACRQLSEPVPRSLPPHHLDSHFCPSSTSSWIHQAFPF